MPSTTSIALVVAAVLFVVFLVAKLAPFDRRIAMSPEARKRVRDLVATARRERTETAWIAAGRALLVDAGRPSRAAALAWRALSAKPTSEAAVSLLHDAWVAMERPYRLERAMWRVLATTKGEAESSPSRVAARRHLIALYDGPLNAPAKADELRRALPSSDTTPSA